MGKKDKKKGKGKEKTAAKTEKKEAQRLKKALAAKGEEDIETLIKHFVEQDQKLKEIGEVPCDQPSPRGGFTFCAHPHKDQLILFGGDYYNGGKAYMYNDLFFYNIKKGTWSQLKCPIKPPPRTAHQAVCVSQGGGQMWIFGGEFASPTHSQFYHYKDLWCFHMAERRWEQVQAPGAPTSRSGHRMALVGGRKLLIFGGFHSTASSYKYFNDVHLFDLDSRQWTPLEPIGQAPSPRSACQIVTMDSGRVLVYGGFTQEKVNKDVYKGVVHTDLWALYQDAKRDGKWRWQQVKQSGAKPSPRCGFSMIQLTGSNKAFLFGGVHDEEEEDELLIGTFYNDLFQVDLAQGSWTEICLNSGGDTSTKKPRRKAKDKQDTEMDEETLPDVSQVSISEANEKVYEDDVFTVTVGTSKGSSQDAPATSSTLDGEKRDQFWPHSRMKAALAIKHGILYLYGGIVEDGDKQFTLSDFYSLDLHKLSEWKTLIPLDEKTLEWLDSDSESDDEEEQDDDDNMDANDGDCEDSDGDSSEMEST